MIAAVYPTQIFEILWFCCSQNEFLLPFLIYHTIQTFMCTDAGEGINIPDNDLDETKQYAEETSGSSPSYTSCGV